MDNITIPNGRLTRAFGEMYLNDNTVTQSIPTGTTYTQLCPTTVSLGQVKNTTPNGVACNIKIDIAGHIRMIRAMLKERETIDPSEKIVIISLASNIRTEIRKTEDLIDKLKLCHDKYLAKTKKDPMSEEMVLHHDIVECAYKNLEECRRLESMRYMSGIHEHIYIKKIDDVDHQIAQEIPDIDDPRFQTMREKDAQIDIMLDSVSDKLQKLKNIAIDERDNVNLQSIKLDDLGVATDEVNEELVTINRRLRDSILHLFTFKTPTLDAKCINV